MKCDINFCRFNVFRFFILFLTFNLNYFAFSTCFGQNYDDLGSWNILNARFELNPKWSISAEAQIRSLKFYDDFHYYETKAVVSYKLSDQISVGFGAGTYQTYRSGGDFVTPKVNNEIRLFPYVSFHNTLGRLKIENRYRLENRFTSKGYRLRVRYRLQAILPINTPKIVPKTIYGVIWNELFMTNEPAYFQRNRFFVGVGYEFSHKFATQIGWINQFDYSVDDETGKNFLQISLLFSFKKKKGNYQEIHVPEE